MYTPYTSYRAYKTAQKRRSKAFRSPKNKEFSALYLSSIEKGFLSPQKLFYCALSIYTIK